MNGLTPIFGNKSDIRHENFNPPSIEKNTTVYVRCLNKECNPNELITHTTCQTVLNLGGWKLYACSPSCFHKISFNK